ncbi:uncharacterized protein LOC114071041, partial [Empidonax traillii]|uniref:uncharacterized protein LOC114071041 n=1 Tax=Empidonax traillii TaxID=164674 RepID=UPI000FFCFB3E
ATIVFENGRVKLEIPEENVAQIFTVKEIETEEIPQEIEHAVVPWVWETGVPGLSKAAVPVVIELKEGAQPVRIKQYPISLEARRGVAPLIEQIIVLGILKECESEFNTPIFPVRKPNGKYRLVQDLRAVNLLTKDIHLVVANPYTLLTSVSEKFQWFSVIDLKDAFFCIPLALENWHFFAFEWENPDTGRKRQLTWTRLPQGYKSSPTIFGNQLAKELEEWKTSQEEGVLEHDCMETIEHVYASRKDLKDEPLENPDWELFTGGSSFVENGDQVYVKNWSVEPLKETWDGPRQVLMTTYTVVKVEGIDNWIHYTRVKKVPVQWVAESITPTGTVFRAVQ